jgi:hypothetical protein
MNAPLQTTQLTRDDFWKISFRLIHAWFVMWEFRFRGLNEGGKEKKGSGLCFGMSATETESDRWEIVKGKVQRISPERWC